MLKIDDHSDKDFLTFTVEGAEVPLSDSNGRTNSINHSHNHRSRNNSGNTLRSTTSNSSGNLSTTGAMLIDEPIIHK